MSERDDTTGDVMGVLACPVCHGQGTVSRPPYVAGDQQSWVANSTGPYPCKPCGGHGVLREEAR